MKGFTLSVGKGRFPQSRRHVAFLVLFIGFSVLCAPPLEADLYRATGTVDVYFSPNGGATNAVVTLSAGTWLYFILKKGKIGSSCWQLSRTG